MTSVSEGERDLALLYSEYPGTRPSLEQMVSLERFRGGDDWSTAAACRDQDPDLFFPAGEGIRAQRHINQAKLVCRICPARGECLDFALSIDAEFGVWGGMSTTDRLDIRSRRARPRMTTKNW